jgi:putative DNA primase/helicase
MAGAGYSVATTKPIPSPFAELLRALHTGGHCGYYWLRSEKEHPKKPKTAAYKRTVWFPVGSPPVLPPDRHPTHGPLHVYFGVLPTAAKKTEHQRAEIPDVAALTCLFAEFDAKDFESPEACYEHVAALDVPATACVFSGGGYHTFHVLDHPLLLTTPEQRVDAQKLLAGWILAVGGDQQAKDLARVLRVPGTVNYKAAYGPDYPTARLEWCDLNTRYTLDELRSYAAPFMVEKPRSTVTSTPSKLFSLAEDIAQAGKNLARLSPSRAEGYNDWLAVGMALTPLGMSGLHLWDNWSQQNAKYEPGVCDTKWPTFDLDEHGLAKLGAWANEDDPPNRTLPPILPRMRQPARANPPVDAADSASTRDPAVEGLPEDDPATAKDAPAAQPVAHDVVLACLNQDEAGDAQLFVALFSDQLCFDLAGIWHYFSGHSWHAYHLPPRQLVWGPVAAAYLAAAAQVRRTNQDDSRAADALIQRAQSLRRLKRVESVLTLAKELMQVESGVWDRDPWLLGVQNGVLDLQTGVLRAGRPKDYIRIIAPSSWVGLHEPAPRWRRFIGEVMNGEADRVAFLQRLLGYAINGSVIEHILTLCVGPRGRNGKRVLFETLQYVLGGYTRSISTDVLVGQERQRGAGSAQPHLMDLQGCRLAYCSESTEDDQFSPAQVKTLTGGDPITARHLHSNLVTFQPTHTLFLQTNRKPQAPADDDALWERVKVIEFKTRFVDQPVTADERPRDHQLEETLRSEASGILAWLVRGGLEWLKHGLQTPPSVMLARQQYRDEESVDPFIAGVCIKSPGLETEAGELYAAYETWATSKGLRVRSTTWFGRQMSSRFQKERANSGRTVYVGVAVSTTTPPGDPNPSASPASQENPSEGISMPKSEVSENGSYTVLEGLEPFSNFFSHTPALMEENRNRLQTLQTLQDDHPELAAALGWIAGLQPARRIALAQQVTSSDKLGFSIPDDLSPQTVIEAYTLYVHTTTNGVAS